MHSLGIGFPFWIFNQRRLMWEGEEKKSQQKIDDNGMTCQLSRKYLVLYKKGALFKFKRLFNTASFKK